MPAPRKRKPEPVPASEPAPSDEDGFQPDSIEQVVAKLERRLGSREEAEDVVEELTAYYSFSGPIPHPLFVNEYNKSIPNGGDRLMVMAEKEQEARHFEARNEAAIWERDSLTEATLSLRGQLIGGLTTGGLLVLWHGSAVTYGLGLGGEGGGDWRALVERA